MATDPNAPKSDVLKSMPQVSMAAAALTDRLPTIPTPGEAIVSGLTGATYTIEHPIGEGSFDSPGEHASAMDASARSTKRV